MTRLETRPGGRPATQPSPYASVLVRPEAVVYAIRYCLGRATYASADGAALAIEHAELIRARGWADVTVRDIDEMLARPHPASVTTDLDRWREARAALAGPTS